MRRRGRCPCRPRSGCTTHVSRVLEEGIGGRNLLDDGEGHGTSIALEGDGLAADILSVVEVGTNGSDHVVDAVGSSAGALAGGVEGDVALGALDSWSCEDEGKSEEEELGEHLERSVELVVCCSVESVMCAKGM